MKKVDVTYLLKHFLTLYLFEEFIYNRTFWKLKSCVYGISGIAEVKCQGTSLGHGDVNGSLLPARHTLQLQKCVKLATPLSFLSFFGSLPNSPPPSLSGCKPKTVDATVCILRSNSAD